jgi:glycosyltransferase involved in cell wall biosynthesis
VTAPALSVVVATYQRRTSLARLLDALARQTLDPTAFEVVVAVDGSTDGTAELLRDVATPFALRSLALENGGRARALNAAIDAAGGRIVLILDDDMEPAPGLLRAHHDAHAAGPGHCVLGAVPIRTTAADPPHVRYLARKFAEHHARVGRPDHRFTMRDFFSGNTSLERGLLESVGGFDPDFRIYGNEDVELARRLLAHGARLSFSAEAVAWQHYEKPLPALARDEEAKGRTAVLLATKHPAAAADAKLAALDRQPRRTRALRRALLALSVRAPRTPQVLVGALRCAGRVLPAGASDVAHRWVLDFLHVLGAEAERRDRRAAEGAGHGP